MSRTPLEQQQSNLPPNNSQQALIPPSSSSGEKSCNHGNLSVRVEEGRITTRQWVTVFILCYVNLINYMDRFTLAGILTQIQCQFGIGDSEAGLLQTVFIISYMVFAPLFGFLGDRYSRKWIMAGGVFLWSLTTLVGSFMEDFTLFTLFRALVGIGEASYSTIAPTIISDMFVSHIRSRMLALFYIVIPVGCGLGYIVGSEMAYIGGSWHWGLRVTPVMGLVAVLLLIFVLVDPPRGEAENSDLKPTSYREDLKYLLKNKSFILTSLGFTCVAFVTGALAWWGPSFIALGLSTQEGASNVSTESVATAFGVITMMAGLCGVVLGSYLSTRLRLVNPRADPLICAFGLLASTPLLFLATIVSQYSTGWCYGLIFLGQLFLNLNWSIVADMLLYVVIPTRRSTAEAFQILLSHTFGDAGSPYLVGILSDMFKSLLASGGVAYLAQKSFHSSLSSSNIQQQQQGDCHNSSQTMDPDPNAFKALQYSLFMTSFVEVVGGLFFLMTAWFIIGDKVRAERAVVVGVSGASSPSSLPGKRFDQESDLEKLTIPFYFRRMVEEREEDGWVTRL